jgi:hypothetical protein
MALFDAEMLETVPRDEMSLARSIAAKRTARPIILTVTTPAPRHIASDEARTCLSGQFCDTLGVGKDP